MLQRIENSKQEVREGSAFRKLGKFSELKLNTVSTADKLCSEDEKCNPPISEFQMIGTNENYDVGIPQQVLTFRAIRKRKEFQQNVNDAAWKVEEWKRQVQKRINVRKLFIYNTIKQITKQTKKKELAAFKEIKRTIDRDGFLQLMASFSSELKHAHQQIQISLSLIMMPASQLIQFQEFETRIKNILILLHEKLKLVCSREDLFPLQFS